MVAGWKCKICGKINMGYVGTCGCGELKENGIQLSEDELRTEQDNDVSSETQMSAIQSNEIVRSYNKKYIFVAVATIVVAIGSIVSCILGTKSAVKTGPEIEGTYINRYNNMYVLEDGIGVHYMFGGRFSDSYVFDEKTKILYIGELAYQYGITENGTEYLLRIMEYMPGQEYEIYYKQ